MFQAQVLWWWGVGRDRAPLGGGSAPVRNLQNAQRFGEAVHGSLQLPFQGLSWWLGIRLFSQCQDLNFLEH